MTTIDRPVSVHGGTARFERLLGSLKKCVEDGDIRLPEGKHTITLVSELRRLLDNPDIVCCNGSAIELCCVLKAMRGELPEGVQLTYWGNKLDVQFLQL